MERKSGDKPRLQTVYPRSNSAQSPPVRQKFVLPPGPQELITYNLITQDWQHKSGSGTKSIITMDQLFLYLAGQIKQGRYLYEIRATTGEQPSNIGFVERAADQKMTLGGG
jgi:hypothetical protein